MRRTILLVGGLLVFTSIGAAHPEERHASRTFQADRLSLISTSGPSLIPDDLICSLDPSGGATPPGGPGNGLPSQPLLNSPPDSATGVSLSPTLGVVVSGPPGDLLTVTYCGRPVSTPPHPPFSLIIIPDTQHYTAKMFGGTQAIFRAQTRWIVDNMEMLNTVFVNHVGDVVNDGDEYPEEWDRAWSAMNILENTNETHLLYGLPYSVSVGNHDQWPKDDPAGATTGYNRIFGVSHFTGRPYYGGHFGSNNDDHFSLFSASGFDFIAVTMEYDTSPDADVLAWADSLFTAYPKRWAIVSVHSLIGTGNPAPFTTQGQATYDALKDNPNLFLMVCGHIHGEGRRSDTYQGHTVHTVMANYQMSPNGGDGWLRIMKIYPDEKVIRVKTYSPTLDQFETDADSSSQFTLPIDLKPLGGWQAIGTEDGVPSGSTSRIVWPGLSLHSEYEWYVTVSVGGTTTGPTWRFTTKSWPPAAHVVYPVGGETLAVGQTAMLRWTATDDVGVTAIDLLLSRTGRRGAYESIATGIANAGSYEWPVSGAETENAFLVVVAYDGDAQAGSDVSVSAFAIRDPTGITDGRVEAFALNMLSPNPLRGAATFTLTVPRQSHVRVLIYDVLGCEVAVLADGMYPPGRHPLTWDGRTTRGWLSSGVYFVKLETTSEQLTRKIVLVR